MNLIDTNSWCGSWPFAPLPPNKPADLEKRLACFGSIEALVSPFETVFQLDPMPGNRAMFQALKNLKLLHPLPVLNPGTAAWEDHLEELAATPGVKGVRLLPAYHGYRLSSAQVRKTVEAINAKGLRLVITARLVDERQEHHAVSIKPVPLMQLAAFLQNFPKLNPLIQGLGIHELEKLSKEPGLFCTDTSFAEWEDTLRVLKGHLPVSRILFGSLSPLMVMLAQADKVRLSSLTSRQIEQVASSNAQKYFNMKG